MIRQRDIRKFNVRYHRNGIAGEGFYLCSFIYLRGKAAIDMRAVVFEGRGRIAVMTDDIGARWRGDDFEPVIREAIEEVERAQPESIHARTFAA